jgi:hypothetical protein
MKLFLFAKHGTSNVALAPNRESLPTDDWSRSGEDSVESEKLMLNLQNGLQRDRFILGTRG